MALKIPPPPYFAVEDKFPGFNRWLLEVTSILTNQGGIDPTEVTGLPAVITQVGVNTANIATLSGGQAGQATAITAFQGNVATINGEITTINGQITTLESNPVLHSGVGAPNAGLGSVNDWYGNVGGAVGARIYIKTAPTVWTAFPF